MVDYRSSSFEYGDDSRRRIKTYYEPIPASSNYNHHHDFRSFSASFAAPPPPPPPTQMGGGVKDFKTKKGKKSKSVCWGFSDPEFERKKRVAGYKLYSVEGKLKAPFRKSVRWLKGTRKTEASNKNTQEKQRKLGFWAHVEGLLIHLLEEKVFDILNRRIKNFQIMVLVSSSLNQNVSTTISLERVD